MIETYFYFLFFISQHLHIKRKMYNHQVGISGEPNGNEKETK